MAKNDMDDIKNYSTKEAIVAFIDVLGSSAAIQHDADKSLNAVHNAYDKAVKTYKNLFRSYGRIPPVKIFSDNIVLSMPAPAGKERTVFKVIAAMSAILQVAFLEQGYLTRGGIAMGSFFADDIMVWGTALVRAYHIEKEIAFFPRIVIDPDLVAKCALSTAEKENEWIRRDADHLLYVDYLNRHLKNKLFFLIALSENAFEKVCALQDNAKACQKWLWFSTYVQQKLLEGDGDKKEKQDAENQ